MRLAFATVLLAACSAPPAPILHHTSSKPEPPLDLRSFWKDRKRANGAGCTEDAIAPVMHRDAFAWAALVETCSLEWSHDDRVGLEAHLDFGRALVRAGYPNDCVDLISPIVTPYVGGLRARDEAELAPIQQAFDDLLEQCQAAHEKKLAAFRAMPCPGAECLAFEGERDDLDGRCRGVTFGGKPLVVEDGPLVQEFCCGIEQLTTVSRGGQRYVRSQGAGFTRVCGGGTASATPDAVYRLEGDKLVLERDFSVWWH